MMVVRALLSITFFAGIAFIDGTSGPLSIKENLVRKQNCGQLSIPTPGGAISDLPEYKNSADDAWLLTVRPKFSGVPFPKTAAFLISPRHIVTSAQVLVSDNQTWRMNGKDLENCCTISDNRHGSNNDVPTEYLNTLEIWDPVKALKLEIVKGRLFFLCIKNDHEHYVPLIMEISPTTRKYPCFVEEEFAVTNQVGLWAHSYGIAWGQNMVHHNVEISVDNSVWFITKNSYKEGGDNRGGPLVHITKEGKPTVIGMKEADPQHYNERVLHHFNLGKFETEICNYTGVCWSYKPVFPTEATTLLSSTGLVIPEAGVETLAPIIPPSGSIAPPGGDETGAPIPPSETVVPPGGGETQAPIVPPSGTVAPPAGGETQAPIIPPSGTIAPPAGGETRAPSIVTAIAQITQRRQTVPAQRPPRPPRPPVNNNNNNNNNNNGNGNGNGNGDTVNTGSNGQLDSISANADANHANGKLELLEIMIFLGFCFYWI